MLFEIFTAEVQMLPKNDLKNRINGSLTHGAESCADSKHLQRAEGTRGHRKGQDAPFTWRLGELMGLQQVPQSSNLLN